MKMKRLYTTVGELERLEVFIKEHRTNKLTAHIREEPKRSPASDVGQPSNRKQLER